MANGFVCSKCGKVYDAGVKFCNECGGCVTAAAEAPAESKRECLIQRTPAEWVDAFFKKSVSKFVNAGFFTRRIENFYFAMNCGDRYVITPQKIEKILTSWDVQPSTVNIDHIIYFFNTGEVFNNKIAGGYFSTEGITLFINQNKNVFSLDKVRVDIPWNEMTEIKIVNYTTDPDPESFAQIFTQFGSQLASAFETLTEAPKPWVVINRQHVISFFGCGYPTVGELCAFFNEIANCKCEIIGDEE